MNTFKKISPQTVHQLKETITEAFDVIEGIRQSREDGRISFRESISIGFEFGRFLRGVMRIDLETLSDLHVTEVQAIAQYFYNELDPLTRSKVNVSDVEDVCTMLFSTCRIIARKSQQ